MEIVQLLPKIKKQEFFSNLTPESALDLQHDISFIGRPKQQLPTDVYWDTLLVLAGRGFGKSFMGSHAVIKWASANPKCRIALIGANAKDTRDIMILGDSGILKQCHPGFRPKYNPSNNTLTFPNDTICQMYSAETPDALRGPQFHYAWCDELAKFKNQEEMWDMLTMTLRLGEHPQTIVTTTPRPTALVKQLAADPATVLITGSTYENRSNISDNVLSKWKEKYEGTRLGRQELYAEILEDNPYGLFQQDNIDKNRLSTKMAPKAYDRVVVAIDPAITNNAESDATGIAVCAKLEDHGYLLDDKTMNGSPNEWVSVAIKAYYDNEADLIVYETNQGGDMVKSLINNADPNIRVVGVRAFKSKQSRAEPISALYEQNRIHHVGYLNELEDEIVDFDPTLMQRSPNRLDSMVYGFSELFSLSHKTPMLWGI